MPVWVLIFFFPLWSVARQTGADSILQVSVPAVVSRAGENKLIPVHIVVKKGFHIQANKVSDEFIIPTTLEIAGGEVLSVVKQKYPAAKKFRLEGTTQDMPVYDGTLTIVIKTKVKEGVQKGKYTVQAKLSYQACDHKTCFFPKTLAFPIAVHVK